MARPSPKVVKKEESSVEVVKPADPLAEAPEPAEEAQEVEAKPQGIAGRLNAAWAEMGAPVPEPDEDDVLAPDAPRDLIGALCALGAQPTKHVQHPVELLGGVAPLSLTDLVVLLAQAGEAQAARELVADIIKRGAWATSRGLIARLRRAQG